MNILINFKNKKIPKPVFPIGSVVLVFNFSSHLSDTMKISNYIIYSSISIRDEINFIKSKCTFILISKIKKFRDQSLRLDRQFHCSIFLLSKHYCHRGDESQVHTQHGRQVMTDLRGPFGATSNEAMGNRVRLLCRPNVTGKPMFSFDASVQEVNFLEFSGFTVVEEFYSPLTFSLPPPLAHAPIFLSWFLQLLEQILNPNSRHLLK